MYKRQVQPTNASTSGPPDSGATEGGSSLAEDILAAPSTLPAQDPVRVETAAYLRRCMLDGTTPPAWVMELVLPRSSRPATGPSKEQVEEVRGDSLPQNLDVVFERVQGPPTPATPIQQSSSSDSNRTSPPTNLTQRPRQHVPPLLQKHVPPLPVSYTHLTLPTILRV